ncbi:MAG: hypothetical protein ABS916_05145 [Carnobacterium sp.]|uniref:hypothetical protein n=1 Tax=Carnobacterium sp. TaxID=48221 RepID=UPI003314B775
MKNKILIFQVLSIIILGISLAGFLLVSPSILAVGTNNFDLGKWLDADVFVIKWAMGLFILGFLLNLIIFFFSLRLKK